MYHCGLQLVKLGGNIPQENASPKNEEFLLNFCSKEGATSLSPKFPVQKTLNQSTNCKCMVTMAKKVVPFHEHP